MKPNVRMSSFYVGFSPAELVTAYGQDNHTGHGNPLPWQTSGHGNFTRRDNPTGHDKLLANTTGYEKPCGYESSTSW